MPLARAYLLDAVFAAALATAALAGAAREDALPPDVTQSLDAFGALLVCGMTLPLALRRALPRGVAIFTVGCSVAAFASGYPVGIGTLGPVFALSSLAYTTSRRDTVLFGVPAAIALITGFVAAPGSITVSEIATNFIVISFTLLIGDLLRVRRDQNVLLGERNRELERLRDTEKRSAVVDERMRIAREVHDVVGHSLVAITLQARAGLRRLSRSPERTGDALREIEGLAARALEETRTAIATIRSDTDGGPVQQQPTLDDLPELIRSMSAPDLDVDLTFDRTARELPTDLQSAAYRIVQESLSNVARHARPAHTAVRVGHDGAMFVGRLTRDVARGDPRGRRRARPHRAGGHSTTDRPLCGQRTRPEPPTRARAADRARA
jgi:signal transduction histidine kinase